MTGLSTRLLTAAAFVFVASAAGAQTPPPADANPPAQSQPAPEQKLTQPELDQLMAPIALYPDPLLSQVLMASTYPQDVAEAHRWLEQNKNLKGKELKSAADQQPWDNSVKQLIATPTVLAMMSDKREWTEKLGDAVIAQESDLMDSVQRLRARAQAADKLKSTDEQTVTRRRAGNRDVVAIEPRRRDAVYVPYYNPAVVYGAWPHAGYPPYYWPGYYTGVDPLTAGIAFAAFGVGAWAINNWWWGGGFDWHNRRIHKHHHRDARAGDRNRNRFNGNRNRDRRDVAQQRDRRDNARSNDRRDRREAKQSRASGKQAKNSSVSKKKVAQRSSARRSKNVRSMRADRGRSSFASQRSGGQRIGRGGGGGGRVGRGGGGRRGR